MKKLLAIFLLISTLSKVNAQSTIRYLSPNSSNPHSILMTVHIDNGIAYVTRTIVDTQEGDGVGVYNLTNYDLKTLPTDRGFMFIPFENTIGGKPCAGVGSICCVCGGVPGEFCNTVCQLMGIGGTKWATCLGNDACQHSCITYIEFERIKTKVEGGVIVEASDVIFQ